ncbi:MAG: hypothetical protein QM767_19740 [Anaeromyxobacter sp.]
MPTSAASLSTAARLLEAILATAGGDVRELTGIAVGGEAGSGSPGEPRVMSEPPHGGAVRQHAAMGGAAAEATVRTGPATARLDAPPEVLAAVAPVRRERAAGGDELRAALAPVLGEARGLLTWARSEGFMSTAGGALLPGGSPAARLSALLVAAAELASFAWLGLTGAPHALVAIERVTVQALPHPGAELGLKVKMIPPESGLWRADVHVVCEGELVAEIRGLTGAPVRAAPATPGLVGDAAERAWRRFCRRMRAEHAAEEVA